LALKLKNDARWMAAAIALAQRGRALTTPNPNVGCVIIKAGRVIGRGWTQPGGRPHAEEMALKQAGEGARGATVYVTLEPCAHDSARGPSCAETLVEAGVARVVIALTDPDPRTNGKGIDIVRGGGIEVTNAVLSHEARRAMIGFMTRQTLGRPFVTLKLATSLDGCIALKSGESRWITGDAARAHSHLERSRANLILVGRGTLDADQPSLSVRLKGLERRLPRRAVLTHGRPPVGWEALPSAYAIAELDRVDHILVEGGAGAAAAFIKAELVDRLTLYRAPILVGGGKAGLADIGLQSLEDAHGRWQLVDTRMLGLDRLEVYERGMS
jgi:diaminohydroxyphosphoribosylaminopyrimidine deaminase / 5-amino-6-(5-phosphoribosylamino)uracil reductase